MLVINNKSTSLVPESQTKTIAFNTITSQTVLRNQYIPGVCFDLWNLSFIFCIVILRILAI